MEAVADKLKHFNQKARSFDNVQVKDQNVLLGLLLDSHVDSIDERANMMKFHLLHELTG
jgi:hypothetical protein